MPKFFPFPFEIRGAMRGLQTAMNHQQRDDLARFIWSPRGEQAKP
jgi:hypothetical protein